MIASALFSRCCAPACVAPCFGRFTAHSPVHAHCAHPSQPLPSRAHTSPKPRPQVKCYLRQLFSGLALLEINEVLHRDLKNANLVSLSLPPRLAIGHHLCDCCCAAQVLCCLAAACGRKSAGSVGLPAAVGAQPSPAAICSSCSLHRCTIKRAECVRQIPACTSDMPLPPTQLPPPRSW